jgi:hypothetical protein
MTQCSGIEELEGDKFCADFVVFVNLDQRAAQEHKHDGSLGFEHLTFYVVPCDVANRVYREALKREYARPKRDGTRRSLSNLAVNAGTHVLTPYRDAWHLMKHLPGVADVPHASVEFTPPPTSAS